MKNSLVDLELWIFESFSVFVSKATFVVPHKIPVIIKPHCAANEESSNILLKYTKKLTFIYKKTPIEDKLS